MPTKEKFGKAAAVATSKEKDEDEIPQPKQPDAIPVQLQIPVLPVPAPPPAPLAAELTLAPSDQEDSNIIATPLLDRSARDPDSLRQPESKVALNPITAVQEHKPAAPPVVSSPAPVLEMLAQKELPNAPTKMDVYPQEAETVDHPLRPPTAKVDGVDDLNRPNRPSTPVEWMASPAIEKNEPAAKSADAPEIAFTATIKESVQPVKAETSGGKNGQRDSNPHESQASDRIQLGPQPQAITQSVAEKPFYPAAPQIKPAETAKPPDMLAVHPVLNERTPNSGAVNSISLKVDSDNSGVDVKLVERGGTIQLAVRTSDRELSGDLRGRLNELVDSLSGKGYETQTWTPDAAQSEVKRTTQVNETRTSEEHEPSVGWQPQVSSTFHSENDSRNFNQGEPGKGGAFEQQSTGRGPKDQGREQKRQNPREEKPKNIFRTILEGARP